jgi:hypothetical protein
MKSTLPLSSIAVLIILFSSCQKDPDIPPNTPSYKVKSYTEDVSSTFTGHNVTTYNIAYDASDRIISVVSATSAGDKFLFAYPSGSHYTLDLYSTNQVTLHEDFFLLNNSFLDSTFQYNDTEDSSTEKYFYNAGNQVIKMQEYTYSTLSGAVLSNTISYSYNNEGDLMISTGTDKNTDTYEYYADLSYAPPITFGAINSNTTKKFHLVKKHVLTSNGSLVGSADFTYTFDSNNRISTENAVASDGSIVLKTYTYL